MPLRRYARPQSKKFKGSEAGQASQLQNQSRLNLIKSLVLHSTGRVQSAKKYVPSVQGREDLEKGIAEFRCLVKPQLKERQEGELSSAMMLQLFIAKVKDLQILPNLNLYKVFLTCVKRNLSSKRLEFVDQQFGRHAAKVLADLLASQSGQAFHELNLDYNKLGDEGLMVLGNGVSRSSLKGLSLLNNGITYHGLSAFFQLLDSHALQSLQLSNRIAANVNKPGLPGLKSLGTYIRNNPHLHQLSLEGCNLNSEGLSVLVSSLRVHLSVRVLSLRNNCVKELHEETVLWLMESEISRLDLSRNRIDNESLVRLGAKNRSKGQSHQLRVKHLNLAANRFGERGCSKLIEVLQQNSFLAYLNLSSNNLHHTQFQGYLHTESKLKTLVLKNVHLGDSYFEGLFNSLQSRANRLRTLDLSENNLQGISRVMAQAFAANIDGLHKVVLRKCEIGDEAGVAIAKSFSGHKAITELDLRSNFLGDNAGAAFVQTALESIGLSKVHLQNNIVKAGVVTQLHLILERNQVRAKERILRKLAYEQEVLRLKLSDFTPPPPHQRALLQAEIQSLRAMIRVQVETSSNKVAKEEMELQYARKNLQIDEKEYRSTKPTLEGEIALLKAKLQACQQKKSR